MGDFEAIRPYNDAEVRAVLARLLQDNDFLSTLTHYRFPRLAGPFGWALRPVIAYYLSREIANVQTVADLQDKVEPYVARTIEKATNGITCSGLENVKKDRSYLFISNHRDIVMDPALVNYSLYHAKHKTPRLAIGDNLLQKPFVSDLMRLNKSFIVHRSVTGRREKLAAFQNLSAYINHSIQQENNSIWIAQAEGRAKDGNDRTDPAILKMFHISRKDEEFSCVLADLHIIPVSISYEYDPCDQAKAHELTIRSNTGSYSKAPGEDDASIARGITGQKGRIHLHFCPEVTEPENDARLLAQTIDRAILGNYRLFPVNFLAYAAWNERDESLAIPSIESLFSSQEISAAHHEWQRRLNECPAEERTWLIAQYAMPVRNQYQLRCSPVPTAN